MRFLSIVCIILCIYLFLLIFNVNQEAIDNKVTNNFTKNGFYVYKNMLSSDEINKIKLDIENNNIEDIKEYISNKSKLTSIIEKTNFAFQDYIWIIKNSSVHTCHRDNNGSFFNKGQKYPSYTVLIYLEDMDKCLGIIPSSHKIKNKNKYNINFTNQVKNIICNKGDIIIFDANLIHVGTINENNKDYLRIQMKISHKDDINILNYYQNYNKILNKKNNLPFYIKNMQKNISCMFPIFSDLTQNENIKTARGTDNGANVGHFQKLFSYFYYGDAKFFDLPNTK